jgi:hypothetical protein
MRGLPQGLLVSCSDFALICGISCSRCCSTCFQFVLHEEPSCIEWHAIFRLSEDIKGQILSRVSLAECTTVQATLISSIMRLTAGPGTMQLVEPVWCKLPAVVVIRHQVALMTVHDYCWQLASQRFSKLQRFRPCNEASDTACTSATVLFKPAVNRVQIFNAVWNGPLGVMVAPYKHSLPSSCH